MIVCWCGCCCCCLCVCVLIRRHRFKFRSERACAQSMGHACSIKQIYHQQYVCVCVYYSINILADKGLGKRWAQRQMPHATRTKTQRERALATATARAARKCLCACALWCACVVWCGRLCGSATVRDDYENGVRRAQPCVQNPSRHAFVHAYITPAIYARLRQFAHSCCRLGPGPDDEHRGIFQLNALARHNKDIIFGSVRKHFRLCVCIYDMLY